jgi:hypothetical protein
MAKYHMRSYEFIVEDIKSQIAAINAMLKHPMTSDDERRAAHNRLKVLVPKLDKKLHKKEPDPTSEPLPVPISEPSSNHPYQAKNPIKRGTIADLVAENADKEFRVVCRIKCRTRKPETNDIVLIYKVSNEKEARRKAKNYLNNVYSPLTYITKILWVEITSDKNNIVEYFQDDTTAGSSDFHVFYRVSTKAKIPEVIEDLLAFRSYSAEEAYESALNQLMATYPSNIYNIKILSINGKPVVNPPNVPVIPWEAPLPPLQKEPITPVGLPLSGIRL